ncbi:phage virion morphogenesis protein [Neisseria weixii]|uniref:phage virion morphogenesis protein n=1 Tax=Neisseria weixii TaxID=1853276 RepID=UPI000BB9765A|nr:phage virion morphogenesis protein [Neisseria weixii]ATD64844.1 phage virion morphogenesis protein [Neisseria weixii]ATD65356.1 phage virion morphogenesis protein [Neisseria weixii]
MLEISLDADQLEHGLNRLLKNATDTRPMMRAIATEMVSLTEDNFENESWGSEKWKQSKRAADSGKTLQLTGQLAASISTKTGNGFAQIGSNKKYAAIHHLGGQAGRGRKVTIPARPYLPINGSGQLQNGAEKKLIDIAIESLKAGL